jgi:hypothetical protein
MEDTILDTARLRGSVIFILYIDLQQGLILPGLGGQLYSYYTYCTVDLQQGVDTARLGGSVIFILQTLGTGVDTARLRGSVIFIL